MSVSCKKSSTSKTKSIVGLESGQEAAIRNSKSPIYLGLSNWFQSFKATSGAGANNTRNNVNVDSLISSAPDEYTQLIRGYLADQIKIIESFEKAVEANNREQISSLLNQETLEMKDIALVILTPETSLWRPETSDKLALALYNVKSKRNSGFIDRFATNEFLAIILKSKQADSFPELIQDAERERLIYLEDIKKLHLSDLKKFAEFLKKTKKSTVDMKRIFDQNVGGTFNLSGSSPLGPLGSGGAGGAQMQGVVAALMKFLGAGGQSFPPQNPNPPIDQNRNQPRPNNPSLPGQNRGGSGGVGGVAGGAGRGTFNTPSEWDSLVGGSSGGGGRSPFLSLSNDNSNPMTNERKEELFKTFLSPSEMNSFSLGEGSNTLPNYPAPSYPCNDQLNGSSLVLCHRVAGYIGIDVNGSSKALKASASSFSGNRSTNPASFNLAEGATKGVLGEIKPGSAESGQGHIFQQGGVGSCSLQAAIGAGYIGLVKANVDPIAVLPQNGEDINRTFNSVQGGQPYIMDPPGATGAITTLRTLLQEKGFTFDSEEVSGWEGAIACIQDKNPVVIGININMASWTSSGGGLEFQQSQGQVSEETNLNLAGDGAVLCEPNGSSGHAVVGVAVDQEGNIIVKNSWGSDWQNSGVAKMLRSSCSPGFYGYCLRNFQNGR